MLIRQAFVRVNISRVSDVCTHVDTNIITLLCLVDLERDDQSSCQSYGFVLFFTSTYANMLVAIKPFSLKNKTNILHVLENQIFLVRNLLKFF